MQISRMMGTSTASALEAVYGDKERKQKKLRQNCPLTRQSDSVSISPEAMNAYQIMRINLMEKLDYHGLNEEEKEPLVDGVPHEGPMAGVPGSGGGDQISVLKSKLEALTQQLMEVMNSGMPEETKAAKAGSIQAQINAVMQQINALMAKAKATA